MSNLFYAVLILVPGTIAALSAGSTVWAAYDIIPSGQDGNDPIGIAITKLINVCIWPTIIVRIVVTVGFVIQAFFQLSFAPVQPHMVSNYYRACFVTVASLVVIAVNVLQRPIVRKSRKLLREAISAETARLAKLLARQVLAKHTQEHPTERQTRTPRPK